MEHGVVSIAGGGIFNAVTGAPTADASTFRYGAYSLRIADASATSTISARKTFTASNVVVARFAVRLATLPSVNSSLAYVDSGTDLVFGYDSGTHRFTVTAGTSTTHLGEYRQRGHLVRDRPALRPARQPESRRLASERSGPSAGLARRGGVDGHRFAFGATANASVYTANFDDIFVANQATAYPLGNGRVVRLLVNGMGARSSAGDFRDDDNTAIDANSWQRLDEVPMTSIADYVLQSNNNANGYLELTFGNTTETCIRDVSAVLAYRSATNGANDGKGSIFSGTTESVIFSGDMSSTTVLYASAIVDPATAPWSQAAVDALVARVGFSSDANPDPYWDAIVLEAAVA